MSIRFDPIGFVKTALSDEEVRRMSPSELEGEIEILDRYVEGLDGIDGFSHLIVLFYLHKVNSEQRKLLKAKPQRFVRYGLSLEDLPLVGVFCLDSPHRPNTIGLSVVRLLCRNGRVLRVNGLDAFNGSPVLDIKPYGPRRRIKMFDVPEWYKGLLQKISAKGYDLSEF